MITSSQRCLICVCFFHCRHTHWCLDLGPRKKLQGRQTRLSWRLRMYLAAVTVGSQEKHSQTWGLGKLFSLQCLESLLLFHYPVSNTTYNPYYLQITSYEKNSLRIPLLFTLFIEGKPHLKLSEHTHRTPCSIVYMHLINEKGLGSRRSIEYCCTWCLDSELWHRVKSKLDPLVETIEDLWSIIP